VRKSIERHTRKKAALQTEVGLLRGASLAAPGFRRKDLNMKHYKILKGGWSGAERSLG